MKFLALALALVLAVITVPYVAEAQGSVKADEQIIIKQLQADRRAVYAQNLGLTEAESTAFWPVYDEYEAAIKKVTDRRLELLDQYAARFDTLTNADADSMLATRMQLDRDQLAIKQKYAKKVQKVLPSVKALRYVQLQDRIDNLLAGEAYALIPLAL
jgi:hypothetical protein